MNDQEQIVEINFDTFSTEEYHEILLLLSVESEITETENNKDFWDHRLYEKTNGNIYLNDDWNREFGGYFIYQRETEKVMTAIQPTRGTSVYTSGGVLHAITPVRYDAPVRESIQVFINE